jgi:hypothetical protein
MRLCVCVCVFESVSIGDTVMCDIKRADVKNARASMSAHVAVRGAGGGRFRCFTYPSWEKQQRAK